MGELYATALKRLSPAGARRLRDDERKWLAFLDQKCPQTPPPTDDARRCLSNAYSDRVADLRLTAIRQGPFLFTRSDTYVAIKVEPDPDDKAAVPDMGSVHNSVPQIDWPTSATTTAWNRVVMHGDLDTDCESGGDNAQDYQLGLVTSRLISVTWSDWEYCHGTPHGHGGSHAQNLVLAPDWRPLTPADLFRSDRPWKQTLRKLLLAAVEKAGRDPDTGGIDLEKLDLSTIDEVDGDPKRWSLRKAGLGVAFDPYELGEGYPFAPDVTIPWSALKGVLVRDPTAP